MRNILATSVTVLAAALLPASAHAADVAADQSRAATFVKDSVITTKIKARLAAEKLSSLAKINVDTDAAGMVFLSGKVETQELADKAVTIARGTEGVTSVNSSIQVGP